MTAAKEPARGRRSWFGRTVRVRLTLLYGGMFLLAGAVLIAVFYSMFVANLPSVDRAVERIPRLAETPTQRTATDMEAYYQATKLLANALEVQNTDSISSMLQQSLLALAIVAAFAVLFGWLVAGRVLRPVQSITDTARRVADRSLHERINLPGPRDEFKELADTFDAMLERLDQSFDSQRRFVANASHELRTPIAVNRTLLEVALAHSDVSPELRQTLTTVLTTNDRSERLIDGLLTIARSENPVVRRAVDLSDLAAGAVEQTAHEASDAGVTIDAEPHPAETFGDPALLERVALNLVQNGIRHNHAGGHVRIRTGRGRPPGQVELLVSNTGPVVRASDVTQIFEPFHRLHASRIADTGGVGLGLSIVESVARTHGGQVHAHPRDGGGLEVRVAFPEHSGPAPDANQQPEAIGSSADHQMVDGPP